MDNQQNTCAVTTGEDTNVHAIPAGSKPGEADATSFKPVGNGLPALIGIGSISPEVLALVRETRATLAASDIYCDALESVADKHKDRPVPPSALFYRDLDFIILDCMGTRYPESDHAGHAELKGKYWYGQIDIIKRFRTEGLASCAQIDATPRTHGRAYNSVKAVRIAEILEAKDEWDAACKAWEIRTGREVASNAWDGAIDHLWALWPKFAHCRGTSLADLLARASLIYDSRTDLDEARIESKADADGIGAVERSILLDLAELSFDLGLPETLDAPQAAGVAAAPDRRAMESYRTWLSNEFRSLTAEMYPDAPEMLSVTSVNNPGDGYHFRGEPPASSRAERILDMFGLDWRVDDSLFADRLGQQEQTA